MDDVDQLLGEVTVTAPGAADEHHKCDECGAVFTRHDLLERHVRTHETAANEGGD